MYKFADNQIGFSDFGQPVGMKMNPQNRWVEKAESIPWEEIEPQYSQLFTNKKGNVAKPLRLALGACIIQGEYGFSDEETALMIQEHPYLQFFCGFAEYKDEPPFDPSLMVYFRKRLTPEILGEINEMIIGRAEKKEQQETACEKNKEEASGNRGTVIIDASCAPSDIRYPTDTSLLNEARENSEKLIDQLHRPGVKKKPRTYRNNAKKEYVQFVRKRKPRKKAIRKCIKGQLGYLRRNLKTIEQMLKDGGELSPYWQERLETLKTVYEQQKDMYRNRVHSVPHRIVSISRPFLRPIVRGKAKSPVEFGAKLDISVSNGFTRLETYSFEAYNEATVLETVVERYRQRTGCYPERVLADKIYRNRSNLRFCKEHGIRLSGPALGRPKKDAKPDKAQEYADICDRVEVERCFSLAKRKCGMGLLTTRLEETTASVIALSIVVLNLRKIQCVFFIWMNICPAKLSFFRWFFRFYPKPAFVQ